MTLRRALRRNADRAEAKLRAARQSGPVVYRTGTIATVTAGASADGRAAVTVTVGGDTIPAPYLLAYTPTVGDMVGVLIIQNSPLIIGKPGGFPVF